MSKEFSKSEARRLHTQAEDKLKEGKPLSDDEADAYSQVEQEKHQAKKEAQAEANQERQKVDTKHDAQVKTRTSRFDQDLKERARMFAINPDNFETEEGLREAVEKAESNNRAKAKKEEPTDE